MLEGRQSYAIFDVSFSFREVVSLSRSLSVCYHNALKSVELPSNFTHFLLPRLIVRTKLVVLASEAL